MESTQDLENLRDEVVARRNKLELTHVEVAALGGPSTTTMSKIEAARGPSPRRDVRRRLEDVFGWQRGSVNEILAGGRPTLVVGPAAGSRGPGRLAALIEDHLRKSGKSEAELALDVGVSAKMINEWRTEALDELPEKDSLSSLAAALGNPRAVLYAAGVDAGYIIEVEIPNSETETG